MQERNLFSQASTKITVFEENEGNYNSLLLTFNTGGPSSKYEHRRTSALSRNIRNVRICMGKKIYRFCNLRKWKDFNKKPLNLLKMCVTSLLCCPRANLWPFYMVFSVKSIRAITSASPYRVLNFQDGVALLFLVLSHGSALFAVSRCYRCSISSFLIFPLPADYK